MLRSLLMRRSYLLMTVSLLLTLLSLMILGLRFL